MDLSDPKLGSASAFFAVVVELPEGHQTIAPTHDSLIKAQKHFEEVQKFYKGYSVRIELVTMTRVVVKRFNWKKKKEASDV